MRIFSSLHRVLLDSIPQDLENSHPCVIFGPDSWASKIWGRGRAGTLECEQTGFESLLSHFLVVQSETKKLPYSSRGSVLSSADWVMVHWSRAVRCRGQSCVKSSWVLCARSCYHSQAGALELSESGNRLHMSEKS